MRSNWACTNATSRSQVDQPLGDGATITAFIVQVALGDLPHGSVGYQTIFAAGLTLFLLTLVFNLIGLWMRKRFRQAY